MSYESIISILMLFCGCIIIVLIGSFIFFKLILVDYKQNSQKMTAEELFETLSIIINSECSILEKDVFSQYGKVLDNQAFENYYHYLTRKCLNDLSRSFLYRASYIMNEEAIIEFICKTISNYLQTKLANGEPEDDNKEEEY